MLSRLAAATIGAALISLPAAAQTAPQAPATVKQGAPNHNVGDPNERICENLTIVGSRLSKKRVCATRAEWAERKREDRQVIDQAQQGRHCGSANTGGFSEGSTC